MIRKSALLIVLTYATCSATHWSQWVSLYCFQYNFCFSMIQSFTSLNPHSGQHRLPSCISEDCPSTSQKILFLLMSVPPVSVNKGPLGETICTNPTIVQTGLNVVLLIFPCWSGLHVFPLVGLAVIRTQLVVKNLCLIVLNDLGGTGRNILPGMVCGGTGNRTGCSTVYYRSSLLE